MNQLMVGSPQQTMTSLEIAELTGKEHGHVKRDIVNMLELLNKDASSFGYIYLDSYKREQSGYRLPYDETICLLTGYDVKARMAVIKRWQELETGPAFQVPTTLSGALRLAAEQAEIIEQQAAQLAYAAPKVAFVEQYVDSTSGSKGFRQVCKLLGAKEPEFRAFLHDEKIMYKLGGEWVPFAQHLDAGRFEVKAGTSETSGHAFNSAKFTAKGVEWVAGEWAKHKIKEAV